MTDRASTAPAAEGGLGAAQLLRVSVETETRYLIFP
jgi:hypothetical protein